MWFQRLIDFIGLFKFVKFVKLYVFWVGVENFGWVWVDVGGSGWVWVEVAGSGWELGLDTPKKHNSGPSTMCDILN